MRLAEDQIVGDVKALFLISFQKLIDRTQATPPSSVSGSDIYDTMFSDSTRGDISPSDLGSGDGSGDDDFTMFDTGFFTGSTVDTTVEESESPASGATTEGKTGTTEFGTEVTEPSDITDETDVTIEGSGTTIEEGSGTSPEEGSGASASTDEFTQTSASDSTLLSNIPITIFKEIIQSK